MVIPARCPFRAADGTCYALDTISDFIQQSSGWGCDRRANLHSACVLRFGARPQFNNRCPVLCIAVRCQKVQRLGWGGVEGIRGSNSVDITFSLSFYLFLAPFLLLFIIYLSYSFLVYFCIPVSLLSRFTSFMSSCLVPFIPSRNNARSFSWMYTYITLLLKFPARYMANGSPYVIQTTNVQGNPMQIKYKGHVSCHSRLNCIWYFDMTGTIRVDDSPLRWLEGVS
jgi:hypothetical protein